MVGQVGNDRFAEQLIDSLKDAGVDIGGVHYSDRSTGTACIFVMPQGENAIVISPGANASLQGAAALKRLEALSPAAVLLSQLETPIETVIEAFDWARARHITTILDPAPAQTLPRELLLNSDFITPNETEAGLLLGDQNIDIDTAEKARDCAEELLKSGPGGVVLKLGRLGCYVAVKETRALVAGFAVDTVDTTGAGDIFNGAFAVALTEGKAVTDAAQFANAAAALSTTRRGAQYSAPERSEVDRFLEETLRQGTTACSR
jgi:ribokinase